MTNRTNTLTQRVVSRSVRVALVGWCALVGLLTLGVVQASGLVTRPYLSRITEVPAVGPHGETVGFPGPLQQVRAVAIDSAHHLFEAGLGAGGEQLDEFDGSSGAFIAQLSDRGESNGVGGLAVDNSNGYLYAGRSREVAVLDATGGLLQTWTGTPSEPFGNYSIQGVAVDNDPTTLGGDWAAGDVFVATSVQVEGKPNEWANKAVDVFKPKPGGGEEYVTQITGVSPSEPFGKSTSLRAVAVDEADGEVLVADGKLVDVFRPSTPGEYELVRQIAGTPAGPFATNIRALAVDAGTGETFVVEEVEIGKAMVVYEFGGTGAYLGRLSGTSTGPFFKVSSVAGDPSTHHLYVTDEVVFNTGSQIFSTGMIDFFGEGVTIPDVSSSPATAVTASSATLNGSVNPLGEGRASCRFRWGSSEELVEEASCPSEYEGSGVQKVQVALSGLQPDTMYYYRLEASNRNGTNAGEEATASCEGIKSIDACFTTLGPGFREQWAENVSATAVTLRASVDPHGKPTSAYVEYGPCAGLTSCAAEPYTTSVPTSPGEALGSGITPMRLVPEHVRDLSPGAVYHYRIVALSEMSPGEVVSFYGPEGTFTTQTAGAFALPDGREWEMVSPPQKMGALVEPIGQEGLIQAAAGGGAFTFHTNQPTEADPAGYANQEQIVAVRGPGGWASRDIAIAHDPAVGKSEGVGEDYRFFSEDLSSAVVQPAGAFIPASSSQAIAPKEASEQTAFLRKDFDSTGGVCAMSCYRPLATGMEGYANVPEGTHFGEEGQCPYVQVACGPLFVGASPNGRHVIVSSKVALTGTAIPPGHDQLYEWSEGLLSLASVLPDGSLPTGGASFQSNDGSARNAVSEDGSRVFWSESFGEKHLYMTDTVTGGSVRLDAVRGGSGEGSGYPVLQAVTPDGSRALFEDGQPLTTDSGANGNLYECAIAETAGQPSCELSDLTPANGAEAANVIGAALGASEDGSWVYFVANGVLSNDGVPVAGAVHGNCEVAPSAGKLCNLYVRHGGRTSLVAVISGEDATDWGLGGTPSELTARVSPDGRWLAFMSDRDLTGYDNRDALGGMPDEELYLYHAGAGEGSTALACASCDPTGGRPTGVSYGQEGYGVPLVGGWGGWSASTWLAADVPGWTTYRGSEALYQSRYLSDSGRLFFDSPGALVPQDVNGTWDVYEYEPAGVGDCTTGGARFSARSNGCVGSISSGGSAEESAFMDASETGGEVFFLTKAKLLAQDFDEAFDVYDAHECTAASPCLPATVPQSPECTTAEACRAAPSPQPDVFGAPPSATFDGLGNAVPSAPAVVAVKTRAKGPSQAQRLARALKRCRRLKGKRRAACRRSARGRYARTAHGHRSNVGNGRGDRGECFAEKRCVGIAYGDRGAGRVGGCVVRVRRGMLDVPSVVAFDVRCAAERVAARRQGSARGYVREPRRRVGGWESESGDDHRCVA